ncbi:MAG: hypothetical protein QMC67_15595 [Candidatus Wallbacteria bacterium]
MISFFSFIFFLALKILFWTSVLVLITAVILILIPVEFRCRLQNIDDDSETLLMSVKWLFSAINVFAAVDVAGYYEVGVVLFGWRVFGKKDIFYDEEII